ncbi:MAG: hypothetical protein M3Q54_11275, partial [Actinomycetota bacterium]|nr:hypothetical protein [Actinomycetota bacterium]
MRLGRKFPVDIDDAQGTSERAHPVSGLVPNVYLPQLLVWSHELGYSYRPKPRSDTFRSDVT